MCRAQMHSRSTRSETLELDRLYSEELVTYQLCRVDCSLGRWCATAGLKASRYDREQVSSQSYREYVSGPLRTTRPFVLHHSWLARAWRVLRNAKADFRESI